MTGTVVPAYSLAERDRRWALARAFMGREGLDALIVFGEHEDAGSAPFCLDTWFTNDRPGATVVFLRTGELISLVPFVTGQIEPDGGDATWISAESIRVGRDASGIVDVLSERGLAKGTIGVAGLEPYRPWHPEGVVPYRLWNTVRVRFPDAEFKPVGLALARLMMPLSQEEIAVVRYSASIGDAMARAMVDATAPGVFENEVYAAGVAAALARGTIVPAMLFGSGPNPMGGGPPVWAYRPQAPRVLQDGDIVRAEVFCNFGMRSTQHQVSIAIGEVHEDFERAALVARESYDAGLRALRPGGKLGEVVEEILKPVEAAGGWAVGPKIHSLNPIVALGSVTGDLGQIDGAESYRVVGSPALLGEMEFEPGMTFALEPNCAFGRRKVTIGGTVVVGDDEPIELNPYTAQLLRARR